MKSLLFAILFLALIAVVMGTQYIPIPDKYPGLLLGNSSGKVTIQLIYDSMCQDTYNFDREVFVPVWDSLTETQKSQINLIIIPTTLPYHLTSYKTLQGFYLVNRQKGAAQALQTLRYFLESIPEWNQLKAQNGSIGKYITDLSAKFSQLTGISQSVFEKELQHGSETEIQTRKWFKHVVGTLHNSGTPSIWLNGAKLDNGANVSQKQLLSVIRKLLQ